MHITKKHEKEPIKRMSNREDYDEVKNPEDMKKTRLGSALDVADFEFDPLSMETSSQIDASEKINKTTDICSDFLQGRTFQNTEHVDFDNTVDLIVFSRAEHKMSNNFRNDDLAILEESLSPDQDHNYIKEDANDNDDVNNMIVFKSFL